MKRPFLLLAVLLSAAILMINASFVIAPSEAQAPDTPRIRQTLEETIDRALPEYQAGLVNGIILGDKAGIDYHTYGTFKDSGVAHLLSISGLHVGVVAAAVNALMKKLRLKAYIAVSVTALLLIAYCWITSFPVSIVRATIMILVSSTAAALGRKNDMLNSLGIAAVVILLIDPAQLFTPGFLLSFGAVLGIALLSKSFSMMLKKLPGFLREGFAISLSATLGTIVITAVFFHQLTALSLLTNIIAIPLSSVAVIAGFAGMLMALVFPPAGAALLFVSGSIMQTVSFIADKVAALPFGNYETMGLHPVFIPLWWLLMYLCSPYFTRYFRRVDRLPAS